jgi:hypothetical protein
MFVKTMMVLMFQSNHHSRDLIGGLFLLPGYCTLGTSFIFLCLEQHL